MTTELIEPVEIYVIDRLAQSIEMQGPLIQEIQLSLKNGYSACHSPMIDRLNRLTEIHNHLLALHANIGKVGDGLYRLEKMDQKGLLSEDDVPF